MREQILIVDDEEMIRELLASALFQEGYICHLAANVDEAFSILGQKDIDLVISDIMMPGRSGVELLRDLKKVDSEIAVLMITGLSDMNTAMECIHLGADDYISKPFNITRVILTVRNMLDKRNLSIEKKNYQIGLEFKVLEQTEQLRQTMHDLHLAYDNTLTALVKALDAREKEVGSHSERVMNYSKLMGSMLGISGIELEQLAKGALLHDIGKIGISDNILLKPGKLDEDEWREMRRHPLIGYAILSEIDFLKTPAEIILSHHERFDGSGYPKGLKGEQIPLGSRIFVLVDTLDAMTSDRPYRQALPFDAVISEVRKFSGSQFDPAIAELFLSVPRSRWEECAGKKFD
ncbi:HD-GYP domain-containing protein [Geobacter sp. SVR]|uniref:HD-GYP domain-containing protein n=1 Tax=Geobacter sp. SVR TaxID=2495594 RepID=UPI00143F0510|nr:HD domain-containing phosphohydrolase [Geobacter sp. SVR]BCS53811.1 two-component system response regulator [Geobacter sp. SVR]GCF85680.1 two-component system response regulator [Geobacter sp. SVR]